MSEPFQLSSYLAVYDRLVEAAAGLTAEQLQAKPSPAEWSVTEVLTHLADHNIVVSFRIREILSGRGGALPAFDQDAWVTGQRAGESTAGDVLDGYLALLVYNSQLLRRLRPEDWEKFGVNFKGEPVKLSAVVSSFVDHAHRHLGQIARIRSAIGAPASGKEGKAHVR